MMRYFNLITVAAILFFSCNSNGQMQNADINLTANVFAEKIKQLPDAPVIDVRTPEEFSKGHLQNALNIDWNGNNFQTEISKFDKSKPVFVYCLSGARSASAAKQMRSDGFTEVYELQGGIMKWRAANLPETTNAAPSTGMTMLQFNTLTNSDKLVLVDFYAEWCAPCKKMKPYLEEISKTMADKVTVIRINVDDNRQLSKELHIDALPVLHLYKDNKRIWENQGYISKEDIVKQLQ